MPINATLTGTAGAGNTVTAGVFNGCTDLQFVFGPNSKMVYFTKSDGTPAYVAIDAATTVTATISGNTLSITVS